MTFPLILDSSSSSTEELSPRPPLPEDIEREQSPRLHGRKIQMTDREKTPLRRISRTRSKSDTEYEKEEKSTDISSRNSSPMKSREPSKITIHRKSSSPRLSSMSAAILSPKHSPKSDGDLAKHLREIYGNLLQRSISGQDPKGAEEPEKIRQINSMYFKISRAMAHNIYYFFDDIGRLITLHDLDKLIVKKYGETPSELQGDVRDVRKDVAEFFSNSKHLRMPDDITKLLLSINLPQITEGSGEIEEKDSKQKNRRICRSILLRIYPTSSPLNVESIADSESININTDMVPIFPPLTFLCCYKKFVTTTLLFDSIAYVLTLDESTMKWYQKLRVLNFCRTWFESDLYFTEKLFQGVQHGINHVIKIGLSLNNEEITKSCLEIDQLIKSWDPSIYQLKMVRDPIKIENELNYKNSKPAFFEGVAASLRLLAAESIMFMSPFDIITDQKDPSSNYFNQVVNLIVEILTMVAGETLQEKTENVAYLIGFFIDVAYSLTEKNDYLSSCAIYSALSIHHISRLYEPIDKKNKIVKVSKEQAKKLHVLHEIFEFKNNHETLKARIHACEENDVFHVPVPALLKSKIMHAADLSDIKDQQLNLHQEEKKSAIDVEKYTEQAKRIWEINRNLRTLRDRFVVQIKNETLVTDIRSLLEKSKEYSEEALEAFSKEFLPPKAS